MQESYKFYTPIRVRFNETDAQGHVNFAHYLSYFDVALTDYLRALGYAYQHLLADNVDMLYVGTRTRYLSPAHFEEVLNIHARIGHIGNSSVRFEFQATATQDGRAVADGEIAVVMVDRTTRQKTPVPARLREAVARFEEAGRAGSSEDESSARNQLTPADVESRGFCAG